MIKPAPKNLFNFWLLYLLLQIFLLTWNFQALPVYKSPTFSFSPSSVYLFCDLFLKLYFLHFDVCGIPFAIQNAKFL